jgi:hypothetical protein
MKLGRSDDLPKIRFIPAGRVSDLAPRIWQGEYSRPVKDGLFYIASFFVFIIHHYTIHSEDVNQ